MASAPASTSNLGPGFDFLGLALGMGLELRARTTSQGPHRVEHLGESPGLDANEVDLVLRCLAAFEARGGIALPPLAVTTRSEIPVGRGFGSSGATIAATLRLAQAVAGEAAGLTAPELEALGVELDGHPDNVIASFRGGCTLGVPTEVGLRVVEVEVHPSIACAVAWPDAPLFTDEARRVLPGSVPLADAVENPRRLALLLEGLRTGDGELLRLGSRDRLHERHRRTLIPGCELAIEAAMEAGAWAATVSGAGSGLVALGPAGPMEAVAEALARPLGGGQGAAVEILRHPPPPVDHQALPPAELT